MSCIQLTVVLLSLSTCREEGPPRRLAGAWVGLLDVDGEPRFVRAEFTPGRSGMTGSLHLAGAGEMILVRASESDGSVGFEMRRGDDELIFLGAFDADSIVGFVHHGGELIPLELHRTPRIARRSGPKARSTSR